MTIGIKGINIKIGFLSILLLLSSIIIMAQPICDPLIDPFCEEVDAPLDANMGILFLFGTLLGCNMLLQNKHYK